WSRTCSRRSPLPTACTWTSATAAGTARRPAIDRRLRRGTQMTAWIRRSAPALALVLALSAAPVAAQDATTPDPGAATDGATAATDGATAAADAAFRAIYRAEWAWRVREFGNPGSEDGEPEVDLPTLPDVSPEAQQRRLARWE